MKEVLVGIIGDLIRIHQKYFRKEIAYKQHVEGLIPCLRNVVDGMLLHTQQDLHLAFAIATNLNKLMGNSVFNIWVNHLKH